MASILPIPTSRVSDAFVRSRLLKQLAADQAAIFRWETAVSTGKRFSLPSENAPAALRAISLQKLLERKEQVRTNLVTNQSFLSASDSALGAVSGILADIRGLAISVADTVTTAETKRAAAEQVKRAIQQLVDTGNQKFRGRYLFAGSRTNVRAFENDGVAVRFDGNQLDLLSFSNIDVLFETNVTGDKVFGGLSNSIQGTVDLNPVLRNNTRLRDLRGGLGISDGSIAISNGVSTTTIDISAAETIGDVARLLETSPPQGSKVTAFVTSAGLQIQLDTGNLTITEVAGGTTVNELGILAEVGVGVAPLIGKDLDPTLNLTTRLADILGVRAEARIISPSANATFKVEAKVRGTAFNGFTVTVAAGGTAGAETVAYDAMAKTLTVNVEIGVSTATQVINAINASPDFQAFTVPGQDGSGTVATGTFLTSGGSGVEFDQTSGIRIKTGNDTVDLGFTSAKTVEDLLNVLNGSDADVLARINQQRTGIDVLTRLSGVDFSIGELGGTTATELGILSFTASTRLSELNHGSGVLTRTGADFSVFRKDGVELQIDLDLPTPAKTIGDVINLINNHVNNTGNTVVARLARFGTGIELVDDNLAGGQNLSVSPIESASTAENLGLIGLLKTTSDNPVAGTFASAALDGAGANDALLFQTKIVGQAGNAFLLSITDSGAGGGDAVTLAGNTLTFDVDVGAGFTAQDAINLLQADVGLNAQFSVQLDTTADPGNDGSGNLAVTPAVNFSGGTSETLTGRDVNPTEAPGIFTALIRLRDALQNDDLRGIQRSVGIIDAASATLNFSRAELGARQQSLDVLGFRLDSEEIELKDKLSQELDVDLIEAISQLTARQAALEASLRTLAQTVQLTLLNFL